MGICKFITTPATATMPPPSTDEWWCPAAKMYFSVSRSGVWIELNHRSRKIVGTTQGHSRPSPPIPLNRGQHKPPANSPHSRTFNSPSSGGTKTKSPFINLNYYAVADRCYNISWPRTVVYNGRCVYFM